MKVMTLRVRDGVGFGLLFGALALSACAKRGTPPLQERSRTFTPDPAQASLVLLTLDTFRGDFFGAAGDPITRTPHLDRLARQGLQLEEGISGNPLTLPSHASIMTGLETVAHDAYDNALFRVSPELSTLARSLKDQNFSTAAFVGAFPLDARFGLSLGFDVYDDEVGAFDSNTGLSMAERPGTEVAARAIDWIREVAEGSRWFAWIHFYDAHMPHDAPMVWNLVSGNDPYRAELGLVDRCVGQIVGLVETLDSPPWILLLADHGESRGEHGEPTHGIFVYDSSLRIPFVVWPRPTDIANSLRSGMVRTIDVPATAFDLLGLDSENAPGHGVNVLRELPEVAYADSHYPYFHFGWSTVRGLRTKEWKYIESPESTAEPELFHLRADPGELHDVRANHPEIVAEFRSRLAPFLTESHGKFTGGADEESRSALESLGYVTSVAAETKGSRPAPRSMASLQALFERSQALLSARRFSEALPVLLSAMARDPKNKEIFQLLGLTYSGLDRHAEAIDAFQRSLAIPPHDLDRVTRFELASSLLRLGRPGPAADHLRQILAGDEDDPSAWYNLGVAYELQKDPESARKAYESALRVEPNHDLAYAALARLQR